jgi:ribonuclease Z
MLLNRENDLHVYGPKGIKEIILLQLRASGSFTGYNLYFHELEAKESEVIFEDETVIVKTIPLNHRVYTNGFLFQEKVGKRHLNIEAVAHYKIEKVYFDKIKAGGSVTLDSGEVIDNELLSLPPDPTKSYAFCSDTQYDESIIPIIKEVDVLYHEATFLDSEAHYTEKTKHATAKEAAQIAKLAQVNQLILGHYSTRYGSIEPFKTEAQTIFENVLLADDGKEFEF